MFLICGGLVDRFRGVCQSVDELQTGKDRHGRIAEKCGVAGGGSIAIQSAISTLTLIPIRKSGSDDITVISTSNSATGECCVAAGFILLITPE